MTIRVFATGTSNIIGRGVDYSGWSRIDDRVRVWNNIIPHATNGNAFVSAAVARAGGTFQNTDRNSSTVWFCHRLAQVRGDDVRLTLVAQGGTGVEEWASGGPMLNRCISVYAATGQAPADVFLWSQSNLTMPAAEYRGRFLALVANLKAAGIIDNSTVILIQDMAHSDAQRLAFNANVVQTLADEHASIFRTRGDGLTTFDDGSHYDSPSLYTLGVERHFAAYAEAKGIKMADLFALVNEGGIPGEPGSGEKKLYNLINLALIGMKAKDIRQGPAFSGADPADNLLTAGMLAAGAVVGFGSGPNGTFIRWENGLQICMVRAVLVHNASQTLRYVWTFPKPFAAAPFVIHAPVAENIVNMTSAKRGPTVAQCQPPTALTVELQLLSNNLFTVGDETLGTMGFAVGWWK